jgi:phosphoribosylanthranilate isomerase
MNRTRVKICGITQLEDALASVNAGADALGFVFYDQSPRAVNSERVKHIISELPPFISKIGLFVKTDYNNVQSVLEDVYLD